MTKREALKEISMDLDTIKKDLNDFYSVLSRKQKEQLDPIFDKLVSTRNWAEANSKYNY